MHTGDASASLARVFAELIDGTTGESAFVLNRGDIGLQKALDTLSAASASRSVNGGATIAAHAQHLRYGLSLMNRWAADGGDPFSDARWDEAWQISSVDAAAWQDIRDGLRGEAARWLAALGAPRDAATIELT